ncbi:MAG: ribonuclease PH, partial [Atopobiaceae bacterium]|nr:ribonuclease PH [Atopobiaceae bacterium]
LDYPEDSQAEVDLNLVGAPDGGMVEVQGTGERSTFDRATLDHLLDLGQSGIARLVALQDEVTGFSA